MNKLDLQTRSWNGTHSYVGDLLHLFLIVLESGNLKIKVQADPVSGDGGRGPLPVCRQSSFLGMGEYPHMVERASSGLFIPLSGH